MRTFTAAQRARALAVVNAQPVMTMPRIPRDTEGAGRVNVLVAARTDTQREIDECRHRRTKLLAEARSLSTEIRSLTRIQQAAL